MTVTRPCEGQFVTSESINHMVNSYKNWSLNSCSHFRYFSNLQGCQVLKLRAAGTWPEAACDAVHTGLLQSRTARLCRMQVCRKRLCGLYAYMYLWVSTYHYEILNTPLFVQVSVFCNFCGNISHLHDNDCPFIFPFPQWTKPHISSVDYRVTR